MVYPITVSFDPAPAYTDVLRCSFYKSKSTGFTLEIKLRINFRASLFSDFLKACPWPRSRKSKQSFYLKIQQQNLISCIK